MEANIICETKISRLLENIRLACADGVISHEEVVVLLDMCQQMQVSGQFVLNLIHRKGMAGHCQLDTVVWRWLERN